MKLHEEFAYADFLAAKKESSAMMRYIDKCYINEADISLLLEDDTVNISTDDANKITATLRKLADQLQKYLAMFLKFMGDQFTKQRIDYLTTNKQKILNAAASSNLTLSSCPNYTNAINNLKNFTAGYSSKISTFQIQSFLQSDKEESELKTDIVKALYKHIFQGINADADNLSDEAKMFLMGGQSVATENTPIKISDSNKVPMTIIIEFMLAYQSYENDANTLINNQEKCITDLIKKVPVNPNATGTGTPAPAAAADVNKANGAAADIGKADEAWSPSELAKRYLSIIKEEFINEAKKPKAGTDANPKGQGDGNVGASVEVAKKPAVTRKGRGKGNTGASATGAEEKVANKKGSRKNKKDIPVTAVNPEGGQPADTNPNEEQKKNNKLQKIVLNAAVEASKGCIKAFLSALSELNHDGFELCKLLVPINIIHNTTGTGQQVVNPQTPPQDKPKEQPASPQTPATNPQVQTPQPEQPKG